MVLACKPLRVMLPVALAHVEGFADKDPEMTGALFTVTVDDAVLEQVVDVFVPVMV